MGEAAERGGKGAPKGVFCFVLPFSLKKKNLAWRLRLCGGCLRCLVGCLYFSPSFPCAENRVLIALLSVCVWVKLNRKRLF